MNLNRSEVRKVSDSQEWNILLLRVSFLTFNRVNPKVQLRWSHFLLLFREPGYSVTSHVTSPPKAEKGDRRLANINVCIIHFHLYKAVVKPELQNQEKCLIIVLIPIPYIQLKFIRGH